MGDVETLEKVRTTHRDTAWIIVVLAEERIPAIVVNHQALPAVDACLDIPSVPVMEREAV